MCIRDRFTLIKSPHSTILLPRDAMLARFMPSYKWNLSLAVHLCVNSRQLSVCIAVFSISTDACCLVTLGIQLYVQRDINDCAWGSVTRSISVSIYTHKKGINIAKKLYNNNELVAFYFCESINLNNRMRAMLFSGFYDNLYSPNTW